MRVIQGIQYYLVLGVLFAVFGCSGQSNQSTNTSDNEPTSSVDTSITELDGAIAFDGPLPEVDVNPPLLTPTNPDQRAAQVSTGRSDPFASLPANPVIVPTVSVNSPPPSQRPIEPVPLATLPNLPPPPLSTTPIPVQPSPSQPAVPGQIPVVPAASQPASPVVPAVQTIQVSGVVDVGGAPMAIVVVPNERGGRSVSVGDRIANGQVLVKRIDVGYGTDPVVVLEQNGVEVVRSVSLSGS